MSAGLTVAIILARGGAKGIPNKNLIDFAGKPLLAWSMLQARAIVLLQLLGKLCKVKCPVEELRRAA